MTDVSLEWHEDFVADSTGDLLLASGDNETRQRLQRRLFTAVRGYIFHQEYGAGLPQKIGTTFSASQIQSIVMSQINLEASVAPNPPPVVIVTEQPAAGGGGLVLIGIQYTDAETGETVSFQITA
jgi:hypothetical protein